MSFWTSRREHYDRNVLQAHDLSASPAWLTGPTGEPEHAVAIFAGTRPAFVIPLDKAFELCTELAAAVDLMNGIYDDQHGTYTTETEEESENAA